MRANSSPKARTWKSRMIWRIRRYWEGVSGTCGDACNGAFIVRESFLRPPAAKRSAQHRESHGEPGTNLTRWQSLEAIVPSRFLHGCGGGKKSLLNPSIWPPSVSFCSKTLRSQPFLPLDDDERWRALAESACQRSAQESSRAWPFQHALDFPSPAASARPRYHAAFPPLSPHGFSGRRSPG